MNNMTKSEAKCKNMAQVCRLAHLRTVRGLKNYNLFRGTKHKLDVEKDGETAYGQQAQLIFNRHYNHIIEVTGI